MYISARPRSQIYRNCVHCDESIQVNCISKNPNPVNSRSMRITFFVSCFSMLFSCLLKNNSALLPVNWLFPL